MTRRRAAEFGLGIQGCPALVLLIMLAGCQNKPPSVEAAVFPQGDVKRGEYLTEIFDCQECHTVRLSDGVQLDRKLLFAGGVLFPGIDGSRVYTANVTLASQYPEEVLDGVIRGRLAYKFAMPTHVYNSMASDDMRDIVAYLKTLQPVLRPLPDNQYPSQSVLPAPNPAVPAPAHQPAVGTLKRGEYLARMCDCQDCHSPKDSMGGYIPGRLFHGGMKLQLDDGPVHITPNITADPEKGIGAWSEADIARAIRTGVTPTGRQLDHAMPYSAAFHGMKDDDVKDLVDFLRSLKPGEEPEKSTVLELPKP